MRTTLLRIELTIIISIILSVYFFMNIQSQIEQMNIEHKTLSNGGGRGTGRG